jgi:hypothetical protein
MQSFLRCPFFDDDDRGDSESFAHLSFAIICLPCNYLMLSWVVATTNLCPTVGGSTSSLHGCVLLSWLLCLGGDWWYRAILICSSKSLSVLQSGLLIDLYNLWLSLWVMMHNQSWDEWMILIYLCISFKCISFKWKLLHDFPPVPLCSTRRWLFLLSLSVDWLNLERSQNWFFCVLFG